VVGWNRAVGLSLVTTDLKKRSQSGCFELVWVGLKNRTNLVGRKDFEKTNPVGLSDGLELAGCWSSAGFEKTKPIGVF
jgi:hypothetical protein